mgnify:CR=1 FL=1
MNRILLLEDDVSLIDGLVYSLKKNEFDVEKYLDHKLTFSKDAEFDIFRIDVTEDEIRQVEINN